MLVWDRLDKFEKLSIMEVPLYALINLNIQAFDLDIKVKDRQLSPEANTAVQFLLIDTQTHQNKIASLKCFIQINYYPENYIDMATMDFNVLFAIIDHNEVFPEKIKEDGAKAIMAELYRVAIKECFMIIAMEMSDQYKEWIPFPVRMPTTQECLAASEMAIRIFLDKNNAH